jgi:preprotein translocase subunit SecY
VTPLFVALALAELLKILVPSVRRWEQAEVRNYYEFNKMVLVLALAVAVWLARDFAFGLEKVHSAAGYLVPQPGPMFQIPCVVIVVAATAFLSWLAEQMTRRGIGSGFWLLLIAPLLVGAPSGLEFFIRAQELGMLSMLQLSVIIAFPVLATALLARAVEADGNRRPLAIWIWPVALAYGALYLLDGFLHVLHSKPVWLTEGHPAHLLALGLLVALFAFLEARSYNLAEAHSHTREEEKEVALPIAIIAAIPIIIAVAAELLVYRLGVPLLFGRRIVTVTIVMLSILGPLGLTTWIATNWPLRDNS